MSKHTYVLRCELDGEKYLAEATFEIGPRTTRRALLAQLTIWAQRSNPGVTNVEVLAENMTIEQWFLAQIKE